MFGFGCFLLCIWSMVGRLLCGRHCVRTIKYLCGFKCGLVMGGRGIKTIEICDDGWVFSIVKTNKYKLYDICHRYGNPSVEFHFS